MSASPLEGIRVLDLSPKYPSMFCGGILADFGADVITIEEPTQKSGPRAGSPYTDERTVRLAARSSIGRNKRSIVLNLKSDNGKAVFYKLAQRADVILESYRPGVVKRLGVDYETISRINHGVVYCSISGFGQNGTYGQKVGHDINYTALSGVMGITGWPDSLPAIPGVQIADIGAGGFPALVGVLIALMGREKTGRGQYIDIAMMDGLVYWLSLWADQYFDTNVVPTSGQMFASGARPSCNVYETNDGKYITLGIEEPWFWANLCELIDRKQYLDDLNNAEKWPEIVADFRQIFKSKTRQEWIDLFEGQQICFAPVLSFDEVFADPHVKDRNMVVEVDHPVFGKLRQLNNPIKMSEAPVQFNRPGPLRGQHTKEVLLELGYSDEEIASLLHEGAVESAILYQPAPLPAP